MLDDEELDSMIEALAAEVIELEQQLPLPPPKKGAKRATKR